jgi:hypothetical protein
MMAGNASRLGFVDVGTFVRTRGRLDGLDRDSGLVQVTTQGGVDVERVVIVDLAKTIVGHTTAISARPWFQLHGRTLSGHRYEYEVTPVRAPGELRHVREMSFDPAHAMTATVDVPGLTANRAYGYRLWLRRPDGDEQPDRELCSGSFTTEDPAATSTTVMFGSCFHPLEEEGVPADDAPIWRTGGGWPIARTATCSCSWVIRSTATRCSGRTARAGTTRTPGATTPSEPIRRCAASWLVGRDSPLPGQVCSWSPETPLTGGGPGRGHAYER